MRHYDALIPALIKHMNEIQCMHNEFPRNVCTTNFESILGTIRKEHHKLCHSLTQLYVSENDASCATDLECCLCSDELGIFFLPHRAVCLLKRILFVYRRPAYDCLVFYLLHTKRHLLTWTTSAIGLVFLTHCVIVNILQKMNAK